VEKNNRKMRIGVIIRDRMGKVLPTLSAPKIIYLHLILQKLQRRCRLCNLVAR